jgi:hypothetical protein
MCSYVGAWLSLVDRPVRDRNFAGSNLVAPTITRNGELRAAIDRDHQSAMVH